MKELAVFRDIDELNHPTLQRLVFNVSKNLESQNIFVDYIELNEIMLESSDLDNIYETSEVFILFGLATLYSCACPIVPVIVMFHNIIDINVSLYVSYTTIRRPIA